MSRWQNQISRPGAKSSDYEIEELGQVQISTQSTDQLLDEIDLLLEDNAQEFVNSFIQKGGE